MRVLSYNIHGWGTLRDQLNLHLLVDVLRRTEADVIGLNEAYHPVPTESGPALGWLAERLGMRVAFAAKRACGYPGDITSGDPAGQEASDHRPIFADLLPARKGNGV